MDIIILSNNSLLLLIYSYETSLKTLKIFNFSKEKTELKKIIDITKKCYNIMTYDFLYENEYKFGIKKLNNKYVLFHYLESTEKKDVKFHEFKDLTISSDDERINHKYCFMFYKYNNNDLILKYEDNHKLYNFKRNVLPYEDAFFFYGNSNNHIGDICFLYFYRNKKMNYLIDGVEHEKINNCIIFDEKYLIVHFLKK